jgi:8-oxo-dGTP diphosphatase
MDHKPTRAVRGRTQMIQVKFYDSVDDQLLDFAVIVARHEGKWVLCKHRERDTYECPGGHREQGESILETAKRELWEETGADYYSLSQICAYSVTTGDIETFGMLYYSDISSFGPLPEMEIEKVELFESLPERWTYPLIQPKLIEKISELLEAGFQQKKPL